MKKCEGFSLIEVIGALSVLSVATISLLSLLIITYQERVSVQEEHIALQVVQEALQEWIYEGKEPAQYIEKNGTTYSVLAISKQPNHLTICVEWKAVNSRAYERCDSAKRYEK